jgi:hypothetical protein
MNWFLFAITFVSAILLLVADINTVHLISLMSDPEKRVVWGGLFQKHMFYFSIVTYLLSSFGVTASFFMTLVSDEENFAVYAIIIVWNVSNTIFDYGLLHNKRQVVLACLVVNLAAAIALFVDFAVVLDIATQQSFSVVFMVCTHICNAVSVFHVTIIDLVIWYASWWKELADLQDRVLIHMITPKPDMRI